MCDYYVFGIGMFFGGGMCFYLVGVVVVVIGGVVVMVDCGVVCYVIEIVDWVCDGFVGDIVEF